MPEEVVAITIISILSCTALGFGLLRTISGHLERKWRHKNGGGSDQVLAELEELRSRVDGSEDLRDRMAELEERVDFAERLLADGKQRDQLRAEP